VGLRDRLTEAASGRPDDGDVVAYFKELLIQEIDHAETAGLDPVTRRARLERVTGHLVSRKGPVLGNRDRAALIRQVVDEVLGLGVLEPLLADETVTEIMVNGPANVFVERAGRLERAPTRFRDDEHLYQTIERIVSAVNRRVDESSPMVDARLPTGERVNVIIPPLSLTGPTLTIRRFPRAYSMDQLIERRSLDVATALLLGAFVRSRLNIIVSGGTGSGKTTLLNALSAFVPDNQRIVTIEDAAELSLRQEHVVGLESRPPNAEGRGQITIRDLVRNSLRMRPDRIIVGEVRGGETLDMLQAMSTGHEGSLATVHANSAADAVTRLETLASMSDIEIPYEALRDQIDSAVDVIVHLARYADGSRRIAEIAAVTSRHTDGPRILPIAWFDVRPTSAELADRTVHGRFRHEPLPARLRDRLLLAGEVAPSEFGPPAPVEPTTAPDTESTGGSGPLGPWSTRDPRSQAGSAQTRPLGRVAAPLTTDPSAPRGFGIPEAR
jgi:pilus assembly protein CpaF